MSNLIKSSSVISVEQLKHLQWLNPYLPEAPSGEELQETNPTPDEELLALRDQILSDAKAFAEDRLRDASEQTEQMLRETEQQIEAWWLTQRAEDEAAAEAARIAGYEQGYSEGAAQAGADLLQQWESRLAEASTILQNAYLMKEQIIQEAEPFLVELSCAIAEKIIGRQMNAAPEMALDLIRRSLARRRELGVITLCVAPSQLAFVQAAREELQYSIDSQAELQILPDSTVKDSGCVIRSAYGSIDARIDTQLAEIKKELIQLAHTSNQERGQSHERD